MLAHVGEWRRECDICRTDPPRRKGPEPKWRLFVGSRVGRRLSLANTAPKVSGRRHGLCSPRENGCPGLGRAVWTGARRAGIAFPWSFAGLSPSLPVPAPASLRQLTRPRSRGFRWSRCSRFTSRRCRPAWPIRRKRRACPGAWRSPSTRPCPTRPTPIAARPRQPSASPDRRRGNWPPAGRRPFPNRAIRSRSP